MDSGENGAPSPRVLIGMPSGDTCMTLTALCLARLFEASRASGVYCEVAANMGSMAVNNRSQLAQLSLQSQPNGWTADALFLVDCDMTFPPLGLASLIAQGEDKDIIGATYQQRCPNGWTHGFELNGDRIDVSRGGLTREVASIPCGFMLIRRRVLETLQAEGDLPFFRFPWEEGASISKSEDYDLCARARARGFRVWVDPELSLAMGHIGTGIFQLGRAVEPAQPANEAASAA